MGWYEGLFWLLKGCFVATGILVGGAATLLFFAQKSIIYPSSFPQGSRDVVIRPDQVQMPHFDDVTFPSLDGTPLTAYLIRCYRDRRPGAADDGAADGDSEVSDRDEEADTSSSDADGIQDSEGIRQRRRRVAAQKSGDPAAARRDAPVLSAERAAAYAPSYVSKPPPTGKVLATDTLIFLHGNAGNIGHRLPLAFHFHTTVRCNVLLLSYRGYGKSGGAASERGIKQDVEAALLWVRGHPDLAGARIVMYGQSIGGAAAIHAAALPAHRHTLAGLILENTFTSLPRLVPHALPQIAWLSFLCTQRWPSDRDITRLDPRLPVLFLSGARDELVPPTMMHELARLLYASRAGRVAPPPSAADEEAEATSPFPPSASSAAEAAAAALASPSSSSSSAAESPLSAAVTQAAEARGVRWRVFPAGTHNDTCVQPGYFAEIGAFWAERLLPR